MAVVSETGAHLTAFPTSKHFASWLGLAPGTKISGGKKLSGRTLPSSNRAAQASQVRHLRRVSC
ncbi:MAG: transposase [Inhella sp.]|uniref:transposase n=1 Tax=Inhella sp. TaxID=1921806 RepID=UPI0022C3B07B|nr:transposase [Inhella sp.]MCZ8235111.1 transposase [Inhella sp.]